MALKFAGRTPSSSLRRPHRVLTHEQASRKSRAWAIRVAAITLLLWIFVGVLHQQIDGFAPISSTRSASNLDVFRSPLLLAGETLRRSGTGGALILLEALLVVLLIWLALSFLGEWRNPSIGFLLLLNLQFFGWAFHEANVRATANIEYSISVVAALRSAWEALVLSQKISASASLLFIVAILWFWGAGIEARAAKWSGPQKAQGFLRERKTSFRLAGLTLMFFAFIATGVLGVLLFGKTLQLPVAPFFNFGVTPPISFVVCILLDAVYFHGRALWRRLN